MEVQNKNDQEVATMITFWALWVLGLIVVISIGLVGIRLLTKRRFVAGIALVLLGSAAGLCLLALLYFTPAQSGLKVTNPTAVEQTKQQ